MQLREMDDRVTYAQQLGHDDGPVVLINQFNLAPEDAGQFLQAWADDSAFIKQRPGYICAQLYRGTAGSTAFINVAVWDRPGARPRRSAHRGSSPSSRATPTAPSLPRTSSPKSPFPASALPSTAAAVTRAPGRSWRHDEPAHVR